MHSVFPICKESLLSTNHLLHISNSKPSLSDITASIAQLVTASIAQLVERPLSEREVVGSNPAAAPYQRCKKWY